MSSRWSLLRGGIRIFLRNLGNYKNSKRLHALLHTPDFSGKTFSKDKAVKYYARIPVAPTFIEMYQYVPFSTLFFYVLYSFSVTMDLMDFSGVLLISAMI